MNVPFTVAREIGTNLSNAFEKKREDNTIEQILSNAMSTGNPEDLQNSIGKILSQVSPERQGPAIQYLQNAYSNVKKNQELSRKTAGEREAGVTPGLAPAVQAQQLRNKQPPKPAGGVTAQAVPIEFGQKISEIIRDNADATADELAVVFDQNAIPPVFTSKYVENRRRQDESKVNQNIAQTKESRKEQLDFHRESQKYDEDLMKQGKIAKNQVQTINEIDKAIKSGNIKPTSWANIFKDLGTWGDKISTALLNKDESTLLSSIPQLLEGWKDVFGVRLSDADLRLLQDKLPSIGKTPEANNAVLKILRKYADMTSLRNEIASEIKSKNKGLRPLGFADQIEKRFDEMSQSVKVINPDNGREIEIPAYKLSEAIKAGARLANE